MGKAQVKDTEDKDKDGFVDELKPGTKLMHGQYTIERFLNAGGFGITYLAKDSLDRKIVIKECFPGAFCRRSRYIVQARSRAHQNELKSIVRLFVQEARSLAKLDHPNIVGVHQVFEDNETAYMALDFVEGRDLLDTIEDTNNSLTPAQIKNILREVLGAVGFIHDQGILHRDISPDNILINEQYHPVLIDFGAAREEATKQSRVLSALRVVKDGYSPQEFYIAGSDQSPSSDLYALAASFHHLIAKEVPPNSQARLAAIASGDTDPYVPLVGRFPDYDEDFLAAIDKALAVLPKDRLQSAQAWIDMMDGTDTAGNVTPLNVANASAEVAPAAAAAAAAAAEPANKSKLPLLLGSAAAVALLVGIGVMTLSGGEEEAAPAEVAATETVAPVETTVSETAAPAEEPVAEPTETASAEPESAAQPEATETAAAEEPAPMIVETPGPVIVDEPDVAEAPEVAEPAEQPGIIAELASPDQLRPELRPESVTTAAVAPEIVEEPEPLPEPVDTPRPVVAEPVAEPELPNQTGSTPTVETATPEVNLPATPQNVDEVGAGPDIEIAAVTPGNELVPEPEPSSVLSTWDVRLPFAGTESGSNVIGNVAAVTPIWVRPGLQVTSVNGTPIQSIDEVGAALRASLDPGEADQIEVDFGTRDPATGEQEVHSWIVPIVQTTELSNGVRFETVFAGNDWRTSVAALPSSIAGDLQVGDVITSYIPTSETVEGREALKNIFDREIDNGTEQFMFAVEREGSMWVASLNYRGDE